MALILNREAMRVVERNERGIVTYRKRYKKGDTVDTSHMVDSHVENLKESGALVESKSDLTVAGLPASIPGPDNVGGAVGDTQPPLAQPEPEQGAGASESDEAETVDEYTSLDYSALQSAAKARNLSAGGSAEDLRNRLREDDASSDD